MQVLQFRGLELAVVAWLQTQMDAMLVMHDDRTEMLASGVAILNHLHTAVHPADFSRRRADGSNMNHLSRQLRHPARKASAPPR